MTTYLKHPKPSPDMDAGRSATPVSDSMKGGGQYGTEGAMGKGQKTGTGMENEKGGKGNPGHKGGSHKKADY